MWWYNFLRIIYLQFCDTCFLPTESVRTLQLPRSRATRIDIVQCPDGHLAGSARSAKCDLHWPRYRLTRQLLLKK